MLDVPRPPDPKLPSHSKARLHVVTMEAGSTSSQSTGMQVLYDRTTPIVADVVFVHGLRGHFRETWTKGSLCWPEDLLKIVIPDIRALSLGYDASVAIGPGRNSRNSLRGHAQNLVSALARIRKGDDQVSLLQM